MHMAAMSGTERCRRARARLKAGRKAMILDVPDDEELMAKALIAAETLSPFDRYKPDAIKKALERVIEIFVLENTE
jgi:hypothetical protein